jgi:hypothetical protein
MRGQFGFTVDAVRLAAPLLFLVAVIAGVSNQPKKEDSSSAKTLSQSTHTPSLRGLPAGARLALLLAGRPTTSITRTASMGKELIGAS